MMKKTERRGGGCYMGGFKMLYMYRCVTFWLAWSLFLNLYLLIINYKLFAISYLLLLNYYLFVIC